MALVPAELEAGTETSASIKPLSNDIFALCTSSAYDDMTMFEIRRALEIADAKIAFAIRTTGSLNEIPV